MMILSLLTPPSDLNNDGKAANSVLTHTKAIDIIHPPPELKVIIDKTA